MMRILFLLVLAFAFPAQSQVHVGADLGGIFSDGDNLFVSTGASGGVYVSARWGVLRARLGALDVSRQSTSTLAVNDDGTIFRDEDGFVRRIEDTGSLTRLASTVTVGLAVPVYRGAGIGLDAGIRATHAEITTGTARSRDVSWSPILAPEVFMPGPRGTRLHLRAEAWPPSQSLLTGEQRGVRLFQLRGGVSVPLRF